MTNVNAIPPFAGATVRDVHESIGVSQLSAGGDENAWYQTIGGLLIQGGRVNDVPGAGSVIVNFNAAYPKKVLGVWLQLIANALAGAPLYRDFVNVIDLTQFELFNDYLDDSSFYWIAVGY